MALNTLNKKSLFLFLLSLNSIVLFAQTNSERSFQYVSSGNFPITTINEIQKGIDLLFEEQKNLKSGSPQKQKLDTLIYNDIYLKNLLLSGEVMYGDSISMYVNKIASELIKDNPDLQKKLHFYVVRSSKVETYNFDKGYIFVTTGLIAQLETEAQFAFLLAHEIGHCVKRHATIIEMQPGFELFNRNQYSHLQFFVAFKKPYTQKELIEADAEALEILKKTDYALSAIDLAFDLLQYKHLPFNDEVFNPAFFEFNGLKIPDTLVLKKVTPILSFDSKSENSSEEIEMHERRNLLEGWYNVSETGKKKYIYSKKEFVSIREIARFALCNDYLADRDYVNAIYSAYILLKKYPNNNYLQGLVSKALYAISIIKTSQNRNVIPIYLGVPDAYHQKYYENFFVDYTDIEGNSQSLYYLFEKGESLELNIFSIGYVWQAYKMSRNAELKPVLDSLFSELFIANKMRGSSFSRISKEEFQRLDSIASADSHAETSKYSKIKTLQTKSESNYFENSLKFAFVNFFKDEEFTTIFDKNAKDRKIKIEKEKMMIDLTLKRTAITKVVFVDPFISYYPLKKESLKKEIEKSAVQKKKYIDLIEAEAKKRKINYQIIDKNDSVAFSIEAYNDRVAIHSWIVEREKNGTNPDAMVLSAENIHKIVEKYGTPYFVFSGIKSLGEDMGPKTVHSFKVYNILSGELIQFDVKIANYVATPQDISLGITGSFNTLSPKAVK